MTPHTHTHTHTHVRVKGVPHHHRSRPRHSTRHKIVKKGNIRLTQIHFHRLWWWWWWRWWWWRRRRWLRIVVGRWRIPTVYHHDSARLFAFRFGMFRKVGQKRQGRGRESSCRIVATGSYRRRHGMQCRISILSRDPRRRRPTACQRLDAFGSGAPSLRTVHNVSKPVSRPLLPLSALICLAGVSVGFMSWESKAH
jgi:hypothetical protein